MDALIDWPPESTANPHDGRSQEVRLAAWKSRQGSNSQSAQQHAQPEDDVIVLD